MKVLTLNRIISFFLTLIMFLFPTLNIPAGSLHPDAWSTDYPYIFVHGLNGWGEYGMLNDIIPYWGTLGGDMMQFLRARGVDARSACIDINDSAWDCACELYAQLTGTRTDYGQAHAQKCLHDRFGKTTAVNRFCRHLTANIKSICSAIPLAATRS